MKKYLNIKTTVLMTSKSTSNLRDRLVERKPSASSSTTLSNVGHSRTASSSTTVATANQTKNLAARLTRDKRKDPVSNPAHPPPVRSVQQTSGVVGKPQKTNLPKSSATTMAPGPSRAVSNPEPKPIVAAMRSQASTHPRTASTTSTIVASTAPRRLQLSSEPKVAAITSQTVASGPRRIPMLPPALKKDSEASKRPASRVDNAVSTASSKTTMLPPPHPTKKVAVDSSAPSKKDVPCAKPPVPKFRPETNTNSTARQATISNSTKPLKAKPTWGRAAPAAKLGPGASQKASAKEVVKKPSSLVSKTAVKAEPPRKRPITPAMVALPPSPGPEAALKQEREAETDAKSQITTGEDVEPESVPSPLPEVEVTVGDDDTDKTIQNSEHTQTTVSPADSRLPTPVTEEAGAIVVELHAEKQGPTSEFELPPSNEEDLPCTPQGNLLPKPAVTNATAKTPISALLFSIERGFMYSPITPLSPADCYLPGPNGEITYNHETHAPRVEGPMQPFNYALHKGTLLDGTTPSQGGLKVVSSRDIGVMGLEERTKLHGMQMGLPLLEDATVTRNAFMEINGI